MLKRDLLSKWCALHSSLVVRTDESQQRPLHNVMLLHFIMTLSFFYDVINYDAVVKCRVANAMCTYEIYFIRVIDGPTFVFFNRCIMFMSFSGLFIGLKYQFLLCSLLLFWQSSIVAWGKGSV